MKYLITVEIKLSSIQDELFKKMFLIEAHSQVAAFLRLREEDSNYKDVQKITLINSEKIEYSWDAEQLELWNSIEVIPERENMCKLREEKEKKEAADDLERFHAKGDLFKPFYK